MRDYEIREKFICRVGQSAILLILSLSARAPKSTRRRNIWGAQAASLLVSAARRNEL
jgi:hypothetical protein